MVGSDPMEERKLVKTERSINWGVYAVAFAVSVVIFGVGIWTGIQIEKSVTEELTQTVSDISQRWISLETLLLAEDSPMFCEYMQEQMQSFDSETYELGKQIGYMEERRGVDPVLKSEYMSLEARDYLIAQKINKRCGTNTTLIFYFVSSSNCQDCRQQGSELTKARESGDIRVYTFDTDVKNGMVSSLMKISGITTYPSMVINGKTFSGPLSAEQIVSISVNRTQGE